MTQYHTKLELFTDLQELVEKAIKEGYYLNFRDIFAYGYLAGKYDLKRLQGNKKELKKAMEQYDKTDDLALLDTISECLTDLDVV